MGNTTLQQFTYSSERMPTHLYGQITFGASGAPTLNFGSMVISTVVRNSTGDFTITLKDKWNRLLGFRHVFNSGSSAPAAPSVYIKTNSITSGSIEIVTNIGGTATDPASGEIMYLDIVVKNSSVTI